MNKIDPAAAELIKVVEFVAGLTSRDLTEVDVLAGAYEGSLADLLGIPSSYKKSPTKAPRFIAPTARRRVSALDFSAQDDGKTVGGSRSAMATVSQTSPELGARKLARGVEKASVSRPLFTVMRTFGEAPHKVAFQNIRPSVHVAAHV